jgi:hypothetical protein
MRNFPSEKALVTAYWRKLARSNGAAHKTHSSRIFAGHTRRRLQMRQRHASPSPSRRYGVGSSEAATELQGPRSRIHSD